MLTCDREQEYRGELNIFKMNFIWILLCKCIGGHSQEEVNLLDYEGVRFIGLSLSSMEQKSWISGT